MIRQEGRSGGFHIGNYISALRGCWGDSLKSKLNDSTTHTYHSLCSPAHESEGQLN